eukprot:5767065-Amphidinium_carterae.1
MHHCTSDYLTLYTKGGPGSEARTNRLSDMKNWAIDVIAVIHISGKAPRRVFLKRCKVIRCGAPLAPPSGNIPCNSLVLSKRTLKRVKPSNAAPGKAPEKLLASNFRRLLKEPILHNLKSARYDASDGGRAYNVTFLEPKHRQVVPNGLQKSPDSVTF